MSRYFSKCDSCRKRKFRIARRVYTLPHSKDRITSQSLLCRKCYKGIKITLNQ